MRTTTAASNSFLFTHKVKKTEQNLYDLAIVKRRKKKKTNVAIPTRGYQQRQDQQIQYKSDRELIRFLVSHQSPSPLFPDIPRRFKGPSRANIDINLAFVPISFGLVLTVVQCSTTARCQTEAAAVSHCSSKSISMCYRIPTKAIVS